ncbi:MAG: sulfate ABC transporter permease [Cyclobacteriaceae bacterium]|nr:sulfate ABC transporter permease [Cyclobacteriaceae bacterium]
MAIKANPLQGLFDDYQHIDKRLFFILVCLITFLLLFIKKSFIESRIAAFEILEQRGEMGIYHLINALQYFSIPLVYLYKFTVSAFILWIGCFLFGYKVYYSRLWQWVMLGECIFFIAEIIKIGWFLFIQTDPELGDIRAFYPLSLMNLMDFREVPDRWHYPLKAVNVFEIMYWIFLVYSIQFLSGKKYSVSLKIVLSSYVFWFMAWLGFFVLVYK